MDQGQLAVIYGIGAINSNEPVRLSLIEVTDNLTPRTLLYGYDCDRLSWHVYSDAKGDIFLYLYQTGSNDIRELTNVSVQGVRALDELVPNKRLYPQYCDFEFCAYLKERGVNLVFTTWEEPKAERFPFAGEVA